MRLIVSGLAPVVGIAVGVTAWTAIFRPPPASARLAGVSVAVAGYTIEDVATDRHRLRLSVVVTSVRALDECLGFALDEPFSGRRLDVASGACIRPTAGRQTASLLFGQLTEDDLRFPSHTLVWGVPGGRCGPIMGLFGVCVVDQAGTVPVELPSRQVLPSFRLGSLLPLFSFPPP